MAIAEACTGKEEEEKKKKEKKKNDSKLLSINPKLLLSLILRYFCLCFPS